MKRNINVTNQGTIKITIPDSSLGFDGNDDYVHCGDISDLGQSFSLSFWAELDSYNTASGNVGIFSIDADKWGISGGLAITRDSGSSYSAIAVTLSNVSLATSESVYFQSGNSSLNESDWSHYMFTFSKPTMTTYLNGVQTDTASWNNDVGWADYTTLIGRWRGEGESFHGKVDNLQVWDVALTSDEAYKSYNGLDIQTGHRIAYWKFDDRDDTTLTDFQENNDGVISGATWTDRSIKCYCTSWNEGNWDVSINTFLDPCDRNYLFSNVVPGAKREIANILGTPMNMDTTYTSSNTLILEPISGYGISSLREKRTVVVKSIQDSFLNRYLYEVKIDTIRLDMEI